MFAHSWVAVAFAGAFTLLLVFAIAWDIRHRRIPNTLVIAMISLGIASALSTPVPPGLRDPGSGYRAVARHSTEAEGETWRTERPTAAPSGSASAGSW